MIGGSSELNFEIFGKPVIRFRQAPLDLLLEIAFQKGAGEQRSFLRAHAANVNPDQIERKQILARRAPALLQYLLEYGQATLEMHVDAVSPGERVLLVDDLLATGGTMEACIRMVEKAGATVAGTAFVIELDFLNGRRRLEPYEVFSLVRYADET
jgi:adenine phosphoribosyltransferase